METHGWAGATLGEGAGAGAPGRTGGREEGAGKRPNAGGAVSGLGAAGSGPNEGLRPEQLSSGNTGCRPWGKSSCRTGRLSYPEKELWVALADGRECAPGPGLWVVSCVCVLFLPPVCSTATKNTLSVCVNEGTGGF